MPVHPEYKELYPPDWPEISLRIRAQRVANKCEWCSAENRKPHLVTGSPVVLSVAHFDHNPANNRPGNLAALCQRCHNTYDAPKRHANRKRRVAESAGQLALPGIV